MSITKPAGRSLTVGELIASLADVDERTPIDVTVGDEEGAVAPIVRVTASRFAAEIVVDSVDPEPLADLLADIVAGEYTLKQAKAEAVIVLRAAGYEVQA
jgi:hypothetical protein